MTDTIVSVGPAGWGIEPLTLNTRFGHEQHRQRSCGVDGGLITQRPTHMTPREMCDMGSLGTTHLSVLLLAVGIIAAACGFTASALRRSKRRSRGFFVLGSLFWVFCAGCWPAASYVEGVAA